MDRKIILFIFKRYAQAITKHYWRKCVYNPLDETKKEIRILRLHLSSNLDDDPVCTLDTITIPGLEEFAALSYVWGDQTNPKRLILNGQKVEVGRNLHTALRYLRRSDGILPIWADALCINQHDVDEKNRQVPLMREIYWNASMVCTWAGEANEDTEESLRMMFGLLKLLERYAARQDSDVDTLLQNSKFISLMDQIIRWSNHIAKAALWRRLWIVQEIVMGMKRRTGFLVIGKHVVFMPRFLQVVKMLGMLAQKVSSLRAEEPTSEEIEFYEDLSHASSLLSLSSPLGTDQIVSSSLLLGINQDLHVADPKDRVYGYLALMPEIVIRPRYEYSVDEVYCDAGLKIAKYCGNLDILEFVDPDNVDGSIAIWASGFQPTYLHRAGRGRDLRSAWKQSLFHFFDASRQAPISFQSRQDQLLVLANCLADNRRLQLLGPINLTKESVSDEKLMTALGLDGKGFDGELVDYLRVGLYAARAMDFWKANGLCRDSNQRACIRTMLFDLHPTVAGTDLGIDRFASYGRKSQLRLSRVERRFADLMVATMAFVQGTSRQALEDIVGEPLTASIVSFIITGFQERRVALTQCGRPCVVPGNTKQGDPIMALAGSRMPWVLRPIETASGAAFRIIGPAYVHGRMDGEIVAEGSKWTSTGNPDAQDFDWEQIALL